MTARTRLALLLFAAPAALSPGQGPVSKAGDRAAGGFVLEAREYPIEELIDAAARYLQRNYLVQWSENRDKPQRTTVFLQQRLELDARGCEEVVSQLAYSCGWVMTPVDQGRGIWEWIHVQSRRKGEIVARAVRMPPAEVLRRRAFKLWVTTAVEVEHARPDLLAQQVTRLFQTNNARDQLSVIALGRRLLLSGYTDAVAVALGMVEELDRQGTPVPSSLEERFDAIETAVRDLDGRLRQLQEQVRTKK